MKNNIFISGKITSDDNYIEKFNKAKRYLLNDVSSEVHVISPTDIDLSGMEYEQCMKITLAILSCCDIIYMLKDWKESKGAQQEHKLAEEMGLYIIYEDFLKE